MKTNCLIVDDEPLSVNIIKEYLSKFDEYSVIGSVYHALDALKYIEKKQIDLIFLDINMPELNGFELIKTLQQPPKIIVISAFKEFALEGYELNIVDFLLKPFSFERFLKAMNKYKMMIRGKVEFTFEKTPIDMSRTIHIKENKKTHNIKTEDILYIESMRDYVKIHTTDDTIVIKSTMHKINELLSAELFVRVHKSFLVAIKHVTAYCSTSVEINGKKIPIGKVYRNEAIKILDKQGIAL